MSEITKYWEQRVYGQVSDLSGFDYFEIGWKAATEAMQAKLDDKDKELEAMQLKLDKALKVVNEQALDEGLWFHAEYVTEAYLQKELRRLTSAIEEK